METTKITKAEPVDMKLEVGVLCVADVPRTRAFYENLGWRLDADFGSGDFHVIQMTPYNSEASVIFGKGLKSVEPGSLDSLVLAVEDVDIAREELITRGVNVSEVFHFAGGPFNNSVENPRVVGRDPQGRSYYSFASFEDPEGNCWLLQEITTRLPGRLWKVPADAMDVGTLAELLHETEQHHGQYEQTHAAHHWWDWYAPYLGARQNGSSPEEATAAADLYMEEVLHILPR